MGVEVLLLLSDNHPTAPRPVPFVEAKVVEAKVVQTEAAFGVSFKIEPAPPWVRRHFPRHLPRNPEP